MNTGNKNLSTNFSIKSGVLKFSAIVMILTMALAYLLGTPLQATAADNGKALIVYYSRTGNTSEIAKMIQARLNCDIMELQTVNPYPEEYRATTEQAKRELEQGYRPPLQNKISNLDDYGVVFVGSPCWWGTVAMPVFTFLDEYDLSGKTICPFMTHEGSGLGRSVEDIKRLCPGSTVMEGLAIRGGSATEATEAMTGRVDAWLNKIGFSQN